MKAVKEDGVFTCVTSSREDIRAHLGSIAEIRRKRELKQAEEEFLEEKDIRIHDGHKKMVEDVYNEIMDGRSNYPVHPQAELLVEADRIAVWETQCMYYHFRQALSARQSLASAVPDHFLFQLDSGQP